MTITELATQTTRELGYPINPSTRNPASMLVTGYPHNHLSDITSGIEGLSLGDMEKTWQDTAASDSLKKYQVGFNDVEYFNLGLQYNCKNIGKDGDSRGKGRDIVAAAMEYKKIDEIKNRKKLIRRKLWMKKKAKENLGEKSNKYRKIIKHLNETANKTRNELKIKYDK